MITAKTFQKAIEAQGSAKQQLSSEMPNAVFSLMSVDEEFIYFAIAVGEKETNKQEIKDLKEKTRFLLIDEYVSNNCYCASFKMYL